MKVFIVMKHFEHEGDEVESVHANKEDADRVCEKLESLEGEWGSVGYSVEKHKVKH